MTEIPEHLLKRAKEARERPPPRSSCAAARHPADAARRRQEAATDHASLPLLERAGRRNEDGDDAQRE